VRLFFFEHANQAPQSFSLEKTTLLLTNLFLKKQSFLCSHSTLFTCPLGVRFSKDALQLMFWHDLKCNGAITSVLGSLN